MSKDDFVKREPKTIVANVGELIDGGSFKCTHGDKVFETDKAAEWKAHRAEPGHTISGNAPCAICGNVIQFSHLSITAKPVCGNCKSALRGDN